MGLIVNNTIIHLELFVRILNLFLLWCYCDPIVVLLTC